MSVQIRALPSGEAPSVTCHFRQHRSTCCFMQQRLRCSRKLLSNGAYGKGIGRGWARN